MSISKLINLVCILAGAVIAIYILAAEKQNTYLLIGGIALLMFGIYRTSRNIPSKNDKQEQETFVKSEHTDEN
jgi:C4-dicarboxylate transporter